MLSAGKSFPVIPPLWGQQKGRLPAGVRCFAKFFDVLQHAIELFLENVRFVFWQIDPRQPCDVRDIEIRICGHIRCSGMQMADKPHHQEP
jgi:hypothetical protein